MVVTKLASSGPAPQVPTKSFLLDFNLTLAGSCPTPIGAKLFSQFDKTRSNKHNVNAAYLDILVQYGSGIIGIVDGLVLSAGTGLHVNISNGGGLCNGLIQARSISPVVCTQSIDNYIWFKQDGSFEARSTNSAPSIPGIFLGIATCNTTNVTAVDKSNVIYVKSGGAYRETADVFQPSDTPNSSLIITTRTLLGTFLWDGNEHLQHVSLNKQLLSPSNGLTALVADYTIKLYDPNNLHFTAASTRKVFAPDPSTLPISWQCNIYNELGSGASILLRDFADTITMATIAPGNVAPLVPYFSSGSIIFNSTITTEGSDSFLHF